MHGLTASAIEWKPFLLGPIFAQHPGKAAYGPISAQHPDKFAYMWTDMERCCRKYEIAGFRRPTIFPRNSLLAARIACSNHSAEWLVDFVVAAYQENFIKDRDISDPKIMAEIIDGLGQDSTAVLSQARSTQSKKPLRDNIEEAKGLKIFGAPSFIIGNELFWGNDRWDDALDYYHSQK